MSERVQVYGDVVHRPAYEWTPTVHALLQHLLAAGLEVPEPVGIDDRPRPFGAPAMGVETVRFVPGVAGAETWRLQATDSGLRSAARLLRRVHDAARSWTPPADAVWAFAAVGGEAVTITHGDPGPWNMVWREGLAVGLIDWDFARPAPALDDVAYALDYLAPWRSDEDCRRWHGFDDVPDRARRVRMFLDAYGADPPDVPELILARKRRTAEEVASLAARGIEPQVSWVADGYLEANALHLEWVEQHRALVDPPASIS